MSARRIDMDRLQELVRRHRLKTGAREVARLLGMSPNTSRVYRLALATQDLLEGPWRPSPSSTSSRQLCKRRCRASRSAVHVVAGGVDGPHEAPGEQRP